MTDDRKSRTIAVCGKGGAGKTTVSALMVKNLAARGDLKILAVDADPAVGLATALRVPVRKTVDDIRNDLIGRLRNGERYDASDLPALLDYQVFDALTEGPGYAFLGIGRPETEGCFCRVNDLLRDVIATLAGNFDVVIIDGEAGVEQINRRVMEKVDDLVLVSDTSAKALQVAETIGHLARDRGAVAFRQMGLVVNRVRQEKELESIRERISLRLLGWIPEDDLIRDYDFRGRSLLELPDASPALRVVAEVIERLGLEG